MTRPFSSRARENLWLSCRIRNSAGAVERWPRCNIPGCGGFVKPGQRWVESHYPVMKANGGEVTGVAHFRCNFNYWCQVEAPANARADRARQRHIGAFVAKRKFPGGRDDRFRKKMDGTVVERGR